MSKDTIIRAIKDRKLLRFSYRGSIKIVEPHLLGERKKKILLSAYQVDGSSKSGVIIPWREYIIDEMQEVETLPAIFKGTRPGYEMAPNSRFGEALAQLPKEA
jgi:hypothetical protein